MSVQKEASEVPRVPDHEVVRLIGRGSYGEIWLARSLGGSWRAIKIVRQDRFEDETIYMREFRGISRFEPISREDKHFVDILHVGQAKSPDFFYFVMELADDVEDRPFDPTTYTPCTLSRVIRQHKRYSAKKALILGTQLSRGLEALHRHGLIHRDIKPSNIIFIRGEPKLADLGLVALIGEGSFVGTEGYVAPEGPFTAQADLYSLGKVLYEVVSGRDRLDFPELPSSLDDSPEDAALGGLNRIILKACAVDPKLRFQSAGEMADAMEALLNGREIRPKLVCWRRVAALTLLPALAGGWFLQVETPPLEIKNTEAIFAISDPPGATVLRGGAAIGVTPLTLSRARGERQEFTFRMPGWEDQVVQIGEEAVEAQATFATGGLAISTIPLGALVDIEGTPSGATPVTKEGLTPGIKKIRLQKPGYLSSVTSAQIQPREITRVNVELQAADRPVADKPWTNTLGMRFVPIGGLYVSTWETRVRDFDQFVSASTYESMGPMQTISTQGQGFHGANWKNPGFPQDGNHPVSGVSWKDAQAFCAWLTEREREAGILLPDEFYRLPTDREWSSFAGIPNEVGDTPEARDAKLKNVYPWNGSFPPPPSKAGNYAGEEMRGAEWPATWRVIAGFRDGYTRTAPVGSFPPNSMNLYDLGGNLWEWCVDKFAATGDTRVLRGASWANVESSLLLSSARTNDMIDSRNDVYGFRCVLDLPAISTLDCSSEPPEAEVWLNGKKMGITPLSLDRVEAGEISLEFRKPGYLTARSTYSIRPRSTEKISAQLVAQDPPDFKQRWTNSLGMRFVPLDALLVSQWETRVSDYRAFCSSTNRQFTPPDFAQTGDHPAVLVNRDDAEAFCRWLTQKEIDAGYISMQMRYRLPSDEEWSRAASLQEKETTPHARDSKVVGVYPWGDWPPSKKSGNFGNPSADGFAQTSPVGSFPENAAGLLDFAGNVWEWCEDNYGGAGTFAKWGVLRGGSWSNYGPRVLLSSYRNVVMPMDRDVIYGFRCVLVQTSGN